MKKFILLILISFIAGIGGSWVGFHYFNDQNQSIALVNKVNNQPVDPELDIKALQIGNPNEIKKNFPADFSSDFTVASEISTEGVVFITTLSEYEYMTGSWFDWFFEPRTSKRQGSGSGVIFTEDGYIVTNNHVIEGADQIHVSLGKETIDAVLIGTDPSTDLAVLKIEKTKLKPVPLGNSANVKVGEWVLAVGNPFNLTSTVTAGIVSARGRNINILKDKFPIESFIQTDAAINPGNSGGALVNQKGELIGINTAILSRTGSYTGYGFAVPVNIVRKVFNDIVKYGELQKVFFGAELVEINSDLASELDLKDLDGVMIGSVQKGGAADKAGLKEGDVIRNINEQVIKNKSDLEEYLANLYPGDEISLNLIRDNKSIPKTMVLLNRDGKTGIIRREIYFSDYLKAEFEVVSKVERDLLRIEEGIKVVKVQRGGIFSQLEIPEGFIITAVNRRGINDPAEFSDIMKNLRGRIEIYGVDASGRKVFYPYYVR